MDSFIAWIGGKKLLRKEICSRFPESIDKYVEVFGGAAWVLFHKDKHARFEVYNDLNSDLVNLFKCVKYHPNAVKEELEFVLNSRELFNDFKELYRSPALTDIQRATKYLYMIKASYGSKVTTFVLKPRDITNAEYLSKIKERLKDVVIENKSFDSLILQHDKEGTLFYCDPPYFEAEKFYDTGNFVFDESQHTKLKEILAEIRGKFILSYNDCPFVRDLYNGFSIESVNRQSNLASRHGTGKVYKEVLIKNY